MVCRWALPSRTSIEAILQAAGLKRSGAVGEVIMRNMRITAVKVTINAVMPGCQPLYMPVVVSAVKRLCPSHFGCHGVATSTGGAPVVVIVNGPAAAAPEIKARENEFGSRCRSNFTISGALRLLITNTLKTCPDKLDRSTLGTHGKIAFCFAENKAFSPLEPLHVECGFATDLNTTTLFACESSIQTYNHLSNQPGSNC